MPMLAAAIYGAARISHEDGSPFVASDFNPWADKPPITLEEAMKKWS